MEYLVLNYSSQKDLQMLKEVERMYYSHCTRFIVFKGIFQKESNNRELSSSEEHRFTNHFVFYFVVCSQDDSIRFLIFSCSQDSQDSHSKLKSEQLRSLRGFYMESNLFMDLLRC